MEKAQKAKHLRCCSWNELTRVEVKQICFFTFSALLTTYVCVVTCTLIGDASLAPQVQDAKKDSKIHMRSLLDVIGSQLFSHDQSHQQQTSHNATTEGGCFLSDKLNAPNLPEIHSVFADHVSGQVVFVGLKLLRQPWHEIQFRCQFANGEFSMVNAVDDRRSSGYLPQYVVVLTCPFPNRYHSRTSFNVHLSRIRGDHTYRNIKVCPTSNSHEKHFLAMCTMVKSMDPFIPQWLEYHRYQGVQHVYIYDNEIESESTLESTLKDFITQGFVTIIPWAHNISTNKTYLEVQIAHENDCIWRHKHDVDWMIKIDVDEYIQPMNAQRPRVIDYLNASYYDNIASIRIQNWFFGHPKRIAPRGQTVIEQNRWRANQPTLQNTGHDKNILRPINVHYFKIHSVKLGGDVISADPYTELRLVHYRTANRRARHFKMPKFTQRDDSMFRIRQAILQQEQRKGGTENNLKANQNVNKTSSLL